MPTILSQSLYGQKEASSTHFCLRPDWHSHSNRLQTGAGHFLLPIILLIKQNSKPVDLSSLLLSSDLFHAMLSISVCFLSNFCIPSWSVNKPDIFDCIYVHLYHIAESNRISMWTFTLEERSFTNTKIFFKVTFWKARLLKM